MQHPDVSMKAALYLLILLMAAQSTAWAQNAATTGGIEDPDIELVDLNGHNIDQAPAAENGETAPEQSPLPPLDPPHANADTDTPPEAQGLDDRPLTDEDVYPGSYRTPISNTLVAPVEEEKRRTLSIDPEIVIGGMFSNYKSLGYFNYVAGGGGVGFTYDEKWHFRLFTWVMRNPHDYTDRPTNRKTTYAVWLIQPAAYALYNVAHFAKYHYNVPMDLYLGLKVGANIAHKTPAWKEFDKQVNPLYGITILPRFYMWKGLVIAPTLEVSTIDYFKNFFFTYGVGIAWDFEVIDEHGQPSTEYM